MVRMCFDDDYELKIAPMVNFLFPKSMVLMKN